MWRTLPHHFVVNYCSHDSPWRVGCGACPGTRGWTLKQGEIGGFEMSPKLTCPKDIPPPKSYSLALFVVLAGGTSVCTSLQLRSKRLLTSPFGLWGQKGHKCPLRPSVGGWSWTLDWMVASLVPVEFCRLHVFKLRSFCKIQHNLQGSPSFPFEIISS